MNEERVLELLKRTRAYETQKIEAQIKAKTTPDCLPFTRKLAISVEGAPMTETEKVHVNMCGVCAHSMERMKRVANKKKNK